jgi:ribosomal protein L37AE/L43A
VYVCAHTHAHIDMHLIICLSAERLRERSKQVDGMVKSQQERLNRVQEMLQKKSKKSSSTSSSSSSSPSSSSSSSSDNKDRASSTGSAVGEKIVVSCAECTQKVRVPAGVTGTISCPACGKKFRTDGKGSSVRVTEGSAPNTGGRAAEDAKTDSTSTDDRKNTGASTDSDGKIVVDCPACAQKLRVKAGQAGTVKCPACSAPFAVSAYI